MALILAGCGTMEFGNSVWITPTKYRFHDCKQLITLEAGTRQRTKELEDLMAKAAQSPGGELIGALGYRTEYQQTLGEHKELERSIGEKRCRVERDSVSSQSVF